MSSLEFDDTDGHNSLAKCTHRMNHPRFWDQLCRWLTVQFSAPWLFLCKLTGLWWDSVRCHGSSVLGLVHGSWLVLSLPLTPWSRLTANIRDSPYGLSSDPGPSTPILRAGWKCQRVNIPGDINMSQTSSFGCTFSTGPQISPSGLCSWSAKSVMKPTSPR